MKKKIEAALERVHKKKPEAAADQEAWLRDIDMIKETLESYDEDIPETVEFAKVMLQAIEQKYPSAVERESKTSESSQRAAAAEQKQARIEAQKEVTTKKKPESGKKKKEEKPEADPAVVLLEIEGAIKSYKRKIKGPGQRTPAKKVSVARRIKDGLIRTIRAAVGKEDNKSKVVHIKLDELQTAREHGAHMLTHLKLALGGIRDNNEGFIEEFESDFNSMIQHVEEKQKEAKKAA